MSKNSVTSSPQIVDDWRSSIYGEQIILDADERPCLTAKSIGLLHMRKYDSVEQHEDTTPLAKDTLQG